MSKTACVALATLFVSFTLPSAAADERMGETPHATWGPALTLGSVAGFAQFRGQEVSAIGGFVALGHRTGRFTLEASYEHAALREIVPPLETDRLTGSLDRLGLVGRVDLLRAGTRWVGENSLLIFFAQAGLGSQRSTWITGDSFRRSDYSVGGGLLLDHRFEKPLGFPSRVGWHLGWRITTAPPSEMSPRTLAACAKRACTPPAGASARDLGLLLGSGMTFTW